MSPTMHFLPRTPPAETDLYDKVAQASAATVISGYSSSFGMACRLLKEPVRSRVRNIYALVRLADEVVDGPIGVHQPDRAADLLNSLEKETNAALADGYSTNLVVHAFALTARRCGISTDLIGPFFSSMRADLSVSRHDADSLDDYINGSAEVVGLMCLRIFLADAQPSGAPARQPGPQTTYGDLAPGARRLGAAFQKVNFLRDLGADYEELDRSYFPGLEPTQFCDAHRDVLLDDIAADLAAAAEAIPRLPDSSRRAVAAAHGVFSELARRLRATPAQQIRLERVRVPAPVKARVILGAMLRGGRL